MADAPITIPIPRNQCELSEETRRKVIKNAVLQASCETDDFVGHAKAWLPAIWIGLGLIAGGFVGGLVWRWVTMGAL